MAASSASHRARSLYLRKEYTQCYALACEAHSRQPGDADVNFLLAKCLEHGHGAEASPASAERHYRLASEAGHSLATRSLGALYERTGCYEEAMECFRRASESGRLNATFSLAQLHQKRGHAVRASQLYEQVLGYAGGA